jgi:hypothetical protein
MAEITDKKVKKRVEINSNAERHDSCFDEAASQELQAEIDLSGVNKWIRYHHQKKCSLQFFHKLP